MEPRAATGEPPLRIGHDLPIYVSEAVQVGLPRHGAAADTGALRFAAQACPTTSVSLPSSAWWASSPQ